MDEATQLKIKKANALGFINHMITAAGATSKQAADLYKKSDEKALRMQKRGSMIADAILADVGVQKKTTAEGLPGNLASAIV